jgi:uncharacterized protein (TIGR00297 family)
VTAERIVAGLLVAIGIAVAALRAGALSPSGAAAAVVVGSLTFGAGGWAPAILMVVFFLTSTIVTRLGRRRKAAAEAGYAKGGRRDAGQVWANGGAAALLSLGAGLEGSGVWFAGIVGALAATTADTWATELGGLSREWPRRITTGERVAPGTSGGVSALGLASAAAGALLIGGLGAWLGAGHVVGLAAALAGWGASVLDSLLGATVQAVYYCPACAEETEQAPLHRCGGVTSRLRGWGWLDNDAVNFLASLLGAGLAMAVGALPAME